MSLVCDWPMCLLGFTTLKDYVTRPAATQATKNRSILGITGQPGDLRNIAFNLKSVSRSVALPKSLTQQTSLGNLKEVTNENITFDWLYINYLSNLIHVPQNSTKPNPNHVIVTIYQILSQR